MKGPQANPPKNNSEKTFTPEDEKIAPEDRPKPMAFQRKFHLPTITLR